MLARPLAPPVLGRRTALCGSVAGLAAVVLVAGCDNGDEITPAPASGSPSDATATASATEDQRTPDQVLVDDVLAELAAALGLLARARKVPSLKSAVTPILRAHRRHVEVLEGDPSGASSPGPRPHPAAMLRVLRTSERRLQASLADAAGRAESGALARLLASISASTTQHLSLLPPEVAS